MPHFQSQPQPQVVVRRRIAPALAPARTQRFLPGDLADRVARLRPLARFEGVALDVRTEGGGDETQLADADRLQDLTMALVRCAIRFTRRGTVSVRIGAPAEGSVEVSVRFGDIREAAHDDGLLWSGATSTVGPALQTLVRKFVTELGAKVGLGAGLDEGSELMIVLPTAGRSAQRPTHRAPDLAGLDVLLIETARSLDGVATLLELQGARVVRRSDLTLISAHRFDVVLIDLDGPTDGTDLLGAVRRAEAAAGRAPAPVLGLASDAQREDAERFFCGGFDAVKLKNVPADDLCATLARLLRNRRPTAPALALPTEAAVAASHRKGFSPPDPLRPR